MIVGASLTAIKKFLESSPSVLLALTVNEKLPDSVGIPEIIPEFDSDKPLGKVPLVFSHVIGVVPDADKITA